MKALETTCVFRLLFSEKLTYQQSKATLLLLARKGETAEELYGCVRALRALEPALPVDIPQLMDTCGTGGDQSHSFNISTVAALLIAGAGGKVAKHGNRAISSKSGSSDLMEALGVRLEAPRRKMIQSIERFGIGYFHAPYYHPVFARVQALRRELKVRTIFNFVGPLLNPLKISAQLVGVAKGDYVPLYARVLSKIIKSAWVCHSADNLDEISTSQPTQIAEIKKGRIRFSRILPAEFGYHKIPKSAYTGGTVIENRDKTLELLRGRLSGPLRDIVVLNAGAGLMISGMAVDLRDGIARSLDALESGRAYRSLLGLRKLSRQL